MSLIEQQLQEALDNHNFEEAARIRAEIRAFLAPPRKPINFFNKYGG